MKWWQYCLLAVVLTGCLVVFMMCTANNPSADDFWRGTGGGLFGFAGGWVASLFGKRIGTAQMCWWQYCLIAMVVTACVTVFMMITANNPSADDFWRGTSGGLLAYFAATGTSTAAGKLASRHTSGAV